MFRPHNRPSTPAPLPRAWAPCRPRLAALALAVTGLAAPGLASAQNSPHAEVDRLVRAGQLEQALQKADSHLSQQTRDPQMRFIRGVILAQQGRTQDAMALYNQLTRDHPELPEPFNNLAVLQAGQNRLDEARVSLEMALRLNPRYATAHQNLGDVYANLAGQAWNQSLQLDPNNPDLYKRVQQWRTLTLSLLPSK